MKIGFDIDDTLISLREYAFHHYNKILEKNVSIEQFNSLPTLYIHEPFGLSSEEGKNLWLTNAEHIFFTNCPPYEGVVDLLHKLVHHGHEIYYITSRSKEYCQKTYDWMKLNNFPIEQGRFFCGMEDHEKVDIIESLSLDYYFDDKPTVIETLTESKTKIYVKDQSYNKHLAVPRINDWQELKNIFKI
ncbi:5' nucleotidase, NT5C type [Bacillus coahuilensis]|uniref:5' nucleotidase, NT5C type n=1 Tax=Bacillus coahuilensis TaxID=408580 RepID=UPI0001850897|nr:HAD hydrolase-like protein [Bacillus coahuilensis]